jgi:hypothetical protein
MFCAHAFARDYRPLRDRRARAVEITATAAHRQSVPARWADEHHRDDAEGERRRALYTLGGHGDSLFPWVRGGYRAAAFGRGSVTYKAPDKVTVYDFK